MLLEVIQEVLGKRLGMNLHDLIDSEGRRCSVTPLPKAHFNIISGQLGYPLILPHQRRAPAIPER